MATYASARAWIVPLLTVALSGGGCGDDKNDKTPDKDASTSPPEETDSGTETPEETDDAGTDSSVMDPPTLTNAAGATCAPVPLTSSDTWAVACWVDDAETICGVDTNQLPGGDPNGGIACVAQDAPGKKSTYCGAFFDQTDALLRDTAKKLLRDADGNPTYDERYQDGALTVVSTGGIVLRFDGCCLPNGECGAILSMPQGLGPNGTALIDAFNGEPFNLHLGCTSVADLAARLDDPDAERLPTAELKTLPYCNYDAEDPGLPTTGTVAGVPAFVCGCGEDKIDDGKGTLPCLNGLAKAVCGADAPTTADLALIPEFICGAVGAASSPFPSLPNVPVATCGGAAVTTAAPLALFPETLCGCGDGVHGTGTCLANVPVTLCGGVAVTDTVLANVPDFLCGCGDGVPAAGRPCVSNVPGTTCGGVAQADPAVYPGLPSFVCGCGPNVVYDPTTARVPCLSHRDGDACGSVAPAAGAVIAGLPKTLCGCGVGNYYGHDAAEETCLPNALQTACGALEPSTAQLADVQPYYCGCGATRGLSGAPCLNYLPTTTCGTGALDESRFFHLRVLFPPSVIGCGPTVAWTPAATGDVPSVLSDYCFSMSDTYRMGQLGQQ